MFASPAQSSIVTSETSRFCFRQCSGQCQNVTVRLTCPSQELGGSIAMHIVATRPLSLDRKSVPAEALEGRYSSSCLMLWHSGRAPSCCTLLNTCYGAFRVSVP